MSEKFHGYPVQTLLDLWELKKRQAIPEDTPDEMMVAMSRLIRERKLAPIHHLDEAIRAWEADGRRSRRRRRALSPRPTTFEAARCQSAADYFAERRARAKPGRALEILAQAPHRPEPDDEEISIPGRSNG